MYFPYLRGKTFELLAVRDSEFLLNNRILPVFEPIVCSDRACGQYLRIAKKGIRFSIIINSANGGPPPTRIETFQMFQYLENNAPDMIFPAFEIRTGQNIVELQNFTYEFKHKQCIIIHRNLTHTQKELEKTLSFFDHLPIHIFLNRHIPDDLINTLPARRKISLNDGFQKRIPNAIYQEDSYFDDLLFIHRDKGFDGFSDFSIIGDTYSLGGGAANHVALHLTECVDCKHIKTNHFVSDNPPYIGVLADKYFSALELLIQYIRQSPNTDFSSLGVSEYQDSYLQRHYPGSGSPVKWSTMHHMEIIDRQLEEMGVTNFI